MELNLEGAGWVWVDRSGSGFKAGGFGVTQTVYFAADGVFRGTLDLLEYDPRGDVASVVFLPVGSPTVQAEPVGDVSAYAQNAWGLAKQIVVGWTGAPDEGARGKAQEMLQQAFEKRLSTDITATLDLRTGQFDFLSQPLGSGVVPIRPMQGAMVEGERFVANELQELRPGVPHVIGPLDPAVGALIDFDVRGDGYESVSYRCECKPVIEAAFAPVLTGNAPTLAPIRLGDTWGMANRGQSTVAVSMPCRWYLVTEDAGTTQATQVVAGVRIHGRTWLGVPVP